jgi:uncharacterized membrane protein
MLLHLSVHIHAEYMLKRQKRHRLPRLDAKAPVVQDSNMSEVIVVADEPPSSLVSITHLVYALHSLSLLIGVTTAATIIGAFVFGVPSIVAVIINYVKRDDARGTVLESHFRWQIRTFWFALLWLVIGGVLFITILGIPLALGLWFAAGLWAIYRVVRGWLALRDRKPMYTAI